VVNSCRVLVPLVGQLPEYDEEVQNNDASNDTSRERNFLDEIAQDGNRGMNDYDQAPLLGSQRAREEGTQNDGDPDTISTQALKTWRSIIALIVFVISNVVVKSFVPLATAVWIFNITAAVVEALLMNDPAPPKGSYIVGYVMTLSVPSSED
jgi:hypothetical protein